MLNFLSITTYDMISNLVIKLYLQGNKQVHVCMKKVGTCTKISIRTDKDSIRQYRFQYRDENPN